MQFFYEEQQETLPGAGLVSLIEETAGSSQHCKASCCTAIGQGSRGHRWGCCILQGALAMPAGTGTRGHLRNCTEVIILCSFTQAVLPREGLSKSNYLKKKRNCGMGCLIKTKPKKNCETHYKLYALVCIFWIPCNGSGINQQWVKPVQKVFE